MTGPTPMFPLGTVLLPGQALPLQIFEPRYQALVQTCLSGPPEFGVVLIERGSEVGGEDVRSDLGTLARIVEATELPDGRWLLLAAGTERFRVAQWLADDPHPWAELTPWADVVTDRGALAERVEGTAAVVRRLLAFATELGRDMPPSTFELPEDPVAASYTLVALTPFGPFDRQRLLGAATVEERLDAVSALATDLRDALEQSLGDP